MRGREGAAGCGRCPNAVQSHTSVCTHGRLSHWPATEGNRSKKNLPPPAPGMDADLGQAQPPQGWLHLQRLQMPDQRYEWQERGHSAELGGVVSWKELGARPGGPPGVSLQKGCVLLLPGRHAIACGWSLVHKSRMHTQLWGRCRWLLHSACMHAQAAPETKKDHVPTFPLLIFALRDWVLCDCSCVAAHSTEHRQRCNPLYPGYL